MGEKSQIIAQKTIKNFPNILKVGVVMETKIKIKYIGFEDWWVKKNDTTLTLLERYFYFRRENEKIIRIPEQYRAPGVCEYTGEKYPAMTFPPVVYNEKYFRLKVDIDCAWLSIWFGEMPFNIGGNYFKCFEEKMFNGPHGETVEKAKMFLQKYKIFPKNIEIIEGLNKFNDDYNFVWDSLFDIRNSGLKIERLKEWHKNGNTFLNGYQILKKQKCFCCGKTFKEDLFSLRLAGKFKGEVFYKEITKKPNEEDIIKICLKCDVKNRKIARDDNYTFYSENYYDGIPVGEIMAFPSKFLK